MCCNYLCGFISACNFDEMIIFRVTLGHRSGAARAQLGRCSGAARAPKVLGRSSGAARAHRSDAARAQLGRKKWSHNIQQCTSKSNINKNNNK